MPARCCSTRLRAGWERATAEMAESIKIERAAFASERDRLTTTLFLAALFHGILILGLTFSIALQPTRSPGLEVALVSDAALPDQRETPAAYAARVAQRGSGTTTERVAARTPIAISGRLADQDGDSALDPSRTSPTDVASRDAVIAAAAIRPTVRYLAQPAPQDNAVQRAQGDLSRPVVPQGTDLVAGVQLTGPRRPDDPLVLADTDGSLLAPYVDSWRRKIERLGTLNYPLVARELGRAANPVLEVEISADGQLRQARVRRSSGDAALDQAALEILKLASPFDPFPRELKARFPSLQFAYEWQFESGQPLQLRSAP